MKKIDLELSFNNQVSCPQRPVNRRLFAKASGLFSRGLITEGFLT